MRRIVAVTPALVADEMDWRRLFALYCAFYEVTLPSDTVDEVWRRILDPAASTKGLIARDPAGRALGLANYVLHQNTWGTTPVCYLEDLYTDQQARGRGVGRALIESLVGMARAQGWSRVYWHTHEENRTARALYDRIAGGNDRFVRYVVRP